MEEEEENVDVDVEGNTVEGELKDYLKQQLSSYRGKGYLLTTLLSDLRVRGAHWLYEQQLDAASVTEEQLTLMIVSLLCEDQARIY